MSAPRHERQPRQGVSATFRAGSFMSTQDQHFHTLEQRVAPYALRDQHQEVVEILQDIPAEEIVASPTLGYWLALAFLSVSRTNEGSEVLRLLEQLHPNPDNLTAGRLLILNAVRSVFKGASEEALDCAQEATAVLPVTALQERFRAWATVEVLSIHFGYLTLAELATERLEDIRPQLPEDQHWWHSFVVPNRADWLLKSGRMHEAEAFLRDHLVTSPSGTQGLIHLRLAIIALEKRDFQLAETHIGASATPSPHSYWYLESELTRIALLRAIGDT